MDKSRYDSSKQLTNMRTGEVWNGIAICTVEKIFNKFLEGVWSNCQFLINLHLSWVPLQHPCLVKSYFIHYERWLQVMIWIQLIIQGIIWMVVHWWRLWQEKMVKHLIAFFSVTLIILWTLEYKNSCFLLPRFIK